MNGVVSKWVEDYINLNSRSQSKRSADIDSSTLRELEDCYWAQLRRYNEVNENDEVIGFVDSISYYQFTYDFFFKQTIAKSSHLQPNYSH